MSDFIGSGKSSLLDELVLFSYPVCVLTPVVGVEETNFSPVLLWLKKFQDRVPTTLPRTSSIAIDVESPLLSSNIVETIKTKPAQTNAHLHARAMTSDDHFIQEPLVLVLQHEAGSRVAK